MESQLPVQGAAAQVGSAPVGCARNGFAPAGQALRSTLLALIIACVLAVCTGCAAEGGAAGTQADELLFADVTLEGGTGKAWVESPVAVDVAEDGSLVATIVWSSSNYDQMVVDGVQYLPVSTEGGSTFQIPIPSLDADVPMQAETTAMSQPHMISYTLHFRSRSSAEDGAGAIAGGAESAASEANGGSEGEGAEAGATLQVSDFHNSDLGNGWQPVDTLALQYATRFAVDYYEGGYKLACLGDGGRYLVVPEDAPVPQGISDDIVVLQQPLGDIYLVASDAMCLFDALGQMDAITVSGISQENWRVPAAMQAMQEGRIVYGGKYSMPDYDVLLASGCRLAIESTMINHTPEVRQKLIDLGIPVLTEQSSYETDPLGRTEWVKLYGALFDQEDLAARLFEEQVAQAQSIQTADTGKTVAFFYINSNGAAVVRRPGDYVTKMIALAGGDYVFDSLGGDDAGASTVTLEMERFYAQAKDADIIIYNANIDTSVDSVADLLAKNELLGNFKAVQTGDVWVTEQNMYQQMMNTGDIIVDFNRVFTGQGDDLAYLHRLG